MFRVTLGSLSTGKSMCLFSAVAWILRLHQDILTSSLLVSSMAVDYPLVLYDCHFEGLDWQQSNDEVNHVLSTLQHHWTQSAVRTHVLHGMIKGLEGIGGIFTKTFQSGMVVVLNAHSSFKHNYLNSPYLQVEFLLITAGSLKAAGRKTIDGCWSVHVVRVLSLG